MCKRNQALLLVFLLFAGAHTVAMGQMPKVDSYALDATYVPDAKEDLQIWLDTTEYPKRLRLRSLARLND